MFKQMKRYLGLQNYNSNYMHYKMNVYIIVYINVGLWNTLKGLTQFKISVLKEIPPLMVPRVVCVRNISESSLWISIGLLYS